MRCQYCSEFEIGHLDFNGKNLGNRMLFETDNFVVFPTIGQIVEGYSLIASKLHYTGMGHIPLELHAELESVKNKVRKVLTDNYRNPLFFEHGPASRAKKGGCCIEHAHFHAVPVNLDIVPDLSKHFSHAKIDDYSALKDQFDTGTPYFFLEDNSGQKHLFPVPEAVPSQYIRQIIARKINMPERWDWRSFAGLEELVRTLERLKGKFD